MIMIQLASASRYSTAAPRAFFAKWVDHSSWAQWSPDTEWVKLDGEVREGAKGVLKPVGGPKVKFTIAECIPDRVYTDVSSFPGARLSFRHTVEPVDAGSALTASVWMEGPLSAFWAKVMGTGFATSVPADLDRLIRVVEAQ